MMTKWTITATPQPILDAAVVKKMGARCSQCSIAAVDIFQTYARGIAIAGAIKREPYSGQQTREYCGVGSDHYK